MKIKTVNNKPSIKKKEKRRTYDRIESCIGIHS